MKRNERKGIGLALAVLALCGAGLGISGTGYATTVSAENDETLVITGSQYEVKSGNGKTLTVSKNDTAKTVTITPVTGDISRGNESLVTGGTVYSVIRASNLNLGYSNDVGTSFTTAVGYDNTATGYMAQTFGFQNKVTGDSGGVGLGTYNEVSAGFGSAVGKSNKVNGYAGSAFGKSNKANGSNSVAFGASNTAGGVYSSAVGTNNSATADRSDAFGFYNTASGYAATAVGYKNYATGVESTAIGAESRATAEGATALGFQAVATTELVKKDDGTQISEVSFGHRADDPVGSYCVTYDKNGETKTVVRAESYNVGDSIDGGGTVTVCEPVMFGSDSFARLTNVADGIGDHDAATVGQLNTKVGELTAADTALGERITTNADAITAIKTGSGGLSELSGKIETNKSDISALSGRVGTAEGDIDALEATVNGDSGLSATVAGHTESISGINATLGTMAGGEYISASNSVAQNLSALDTRAKTNADAIATNADNITGLGNRVTTAEGDIDALEATVNGDSGLSATVSGHTQSISALQSADNALDAKITTNKEAINQINTSISGLSTLTSTVEGHTTAIGTNTENIAKNKKAIEDNDAELEAIRTGTGGLSFINGSLSSLSEALGTLSGNGNYIVAGNSVSANLVALDAQVKLNNTKIGENATAIGGLNTRLGTAETDIDNLETTAGGHTQSISSINGSLISLDTRIGNNATAISGLDSRVTKNASDIEAINSSISGLTDLTSTVGSQADSISGLDSRLGTAEGKISANETAIRMNASAIDAVEAKIGTLKADEGETKAYTYLDSKKTVSGNLESLEEAIKASTKGDDQNRVTIGNNSEVTGKDSTAIGTGVKITGENSVAVGTGHQIAGSNSGAFGDPSTISSSDSYALGNNNTITGGTNAFVIGNSVSTTSSNVVILGNQSSTTQMTGAESSAAQDNVISVGSMTNLRRIINVADGVYSADAATYGQSVKNTTYTIAYGTNGQGTTTGSVEVLTNDGQVAFTINGFLPNAADAEAAKAGTLTQKDYTNYTGDNETIAISNNNVISAKTGSIVTGDKGLITGGAAYDELRKDISGSYVKYNATTAANLSALDVAIGSNAAVATEGGYIANDASVNANLSALNKKAAKSGQIISAVTTDGGNVIKAVDGTALATISVGTIEAGQNGFVSGDAVHDAIKAAKTAASEDATLKVGTAKTELTSAIETAKEQAISTAGTNAATELAKLIAYNSSAGVLNIGADALLATSVNFGYGDNSTRKLTGVTAGTELTDAANVGQLIANTTYVVANNGTVEVKTKSGGTAFTISGIPVSASGDGNSNPIAYTADNETIQIDSNNNRISAKTGVVSSGNDGKGLITGNAAYSELRPTNGTYVKTEQTTAANLTALDGAVKANKESIDSLGSRVGTNETNISGLTEKIGTIATVEGGYNYIGATDSVSANLVKLDKAIKDSSVKVAENASAAIGSSVSVDANASNVTAVGNSITVSGKDSTAIGTNIEITGENSVAVGNGHKVYGKNSGAFGDPNNVYGTGSYAAGNTITIGEENNVNGVGNNTFVFGNNVTTTANNAVILGNESTATEDNVVSVGSETNQRRIVNVAAGENDTDAVNMGQLKEAMNGSAVDVSRALGTLDSRINDVAAGAAALAALHPTEYDPNDKLSFAVGYGHYKNANAGAIGAFFQPNEDVTVSLGSTFGNGNPMVNAGVSFKLGRRGEKMAEPDAKMIRALKSENASQAKEIDSQAKKIETLEASHARQEKEIEELRAKIAQVLAKMELSDTVEKSAAAH